MLIAASEGDAVEFEIAAFWNTQTKAKDGSMADNIVQGVAAYMNSSEGGALNQNNGVWYSISFHQIEGNNVCGISVRPANRPVYVNGDLYMRIGNEAAERAASGGVCGATVGEIEL